MSDPREGTKASGPLRPLHVVLFVVLTGAASTAAFFVGRTNGEARGEARRLAALAEIERDTVRRIEQEQEVRWHAPPDPHARVQACLRALEAVRAATARPPNDRPERPGTGRGRRGGQNVDDPLAGLEF